MFLPTFYGVQHSLPFEHIVNSVTHRIKPGVKVGLEVGIDPKMLPSKRWRDFITKYDLAKHIEQDEFDRLAEIVKEKSGKIVWLEKPSTRWVGKKAHINKLADELIPRVEAGKLKPRAALDHLCNVLDDPFLVGNFQHNYNRSLHMEHRVKREKWNEGDFVLTGIAHSWDMEANLKEQGHDPLVVSLLQTSPRVENRIKTNMAQQREYVKIATRNFHAQRKIQNQRK